MLFQLIGVPNLNQRARELPPFRTSLTTSGLFVLLAKQVMLFWIGSDFLTNYLTLEEYDKPEKIISQSLLDKLSFVYDQSQGADEDLTKAGDEVHHKKTLFCIEGREGPLFTEYINGEKVDLGIIGKKKTAKARQEGDSSSDGIPECSSEEELFEMLEYENSLTKAYWIPQEPNLYALIIKNTKLYYSECGEDNESD